MNRPCFFTLAFLALDGVCCAQTPIDPDRLPQLRSFFEQPAVKPEIACTVTQLKPDLNYSFRFQAGYLASWPLKNYQGSGNSFAILTRITPLAPAGDPSFFTQAFEMRSIPPGARTKLQVDGAYFFGEGSYALDLAILDRDSHTCRKQWRIEVKSPGKNRQIKPAQEPGTVQPAVLDRWDGRLGDAGDQVSNQATPRRLTVLMHVAPLYFWTNQLHAYDRAMLLSSLLALLRQTSFTQVKLVAFNLDQQSELFRQERFDAGGWDQLLRSMHKLELATVSFQVLQKRTGSVDLLAGLIDEELQAEPASDVVLFLGPTARQNEKLRWPPTGSESARPLFVYFEFKPYWRRGYEFPDIFFHATRAQSGKVFRIHSPVELVDALHSMERLAAERRPLAAHNPIER